MYCITVKEDMRRETGLLEFGSIEESLTGGIKDPV